MGTCLIKLSRNVRHFDVESNVSTLVLGILKLFKYLSWLCFPLPSISDFYSIIFETLSACVIFCLKPKYLILASVVQKHKKIFSRKLL